MTKICRTGLSLELVTVVLAMLAGCGDPDPTPSGDSGPPADSGPVGCTSDADCADAVDCTTDTCVAASGACRHIVTPALCAAGESCDRMTGCEPGRACATDGDCADTDACTSMESCDPALRVCTYVLLDGDGDGDPPRICGGGDCNDSYYEAHAGAPELCDTVDNDCDGVTDNNGADAMCGANRVCAAGLCECAPGMTDCDGQCVDLTNDPMNCRVCYSTCDSGTCAASACVCAAGLTSCVDPFTDASTCVDTDTSIYDCGGCGIYGGDVCSNGVGACAREGRFSTCVAGALVCDAIPGPPTTETCNGLDDDCDGTVDDGNPDSGAACTNGLGPCLRSGVRVCSAGALVCNAAPGPAVPEACNGVDDNCNGTVDDGFAPLGCGVGVCARTIEACVSGTPRTCVAGTPGVEVCNGLDDDCDGTIDDGLPGCEIVEVSTGEDHTCARRGSGAVVCWGYNNNGQLGDGTTTSRLTQAPVSGLTDAVELATGYGHSCARRSSGEVVCWGYNNNGQLGGAIGLTALTPVAVTGLTDAVEILAGPDYSCARRSTGGVACWGNNWSGQLGDGTTTNRRTPGPVSGLTDAVEIAASPADYSHHACARRASGAVVCWGRNTLGQLGDGTFTTRLTPTPVRDLTDAIELAVGGGHSCARRVAGTVVCWGHNYSGQVGDGTTTSRYRPTLVSGLTDAIELTAGGGHNCARRATGVSVCWGGNYSGQLGDGTTTDSLTPTPVFGLADAVDLSAGASRTCARRSSNAVVCWGDNTNGELGDGTTTNRLTPTPVVGL